MPRYYCDYCDTYLTHDSPSVRKQHNAGYKHKANVRTYYQQFEAQLNQNLIDQKVKEHLGLAAYQPVGAAYNQLRPRLPVLPTPQMLPIGGNPQMPPGSLPGIRLPMLPRPFPGPPGYPPQMMAPPGAPSMPGQVNGLPRPGTEGGPTGIPGSSAPPPTSSGGLPNFVPAMYQQQPNTAQQVGGGGGGGGGFDSSNVDAQS